VSRYYKQENWDKELVVEQSPSSKDVNMEAENIVRIHHQATTGEDAAD
jgi:hypothetical protein